MMNDTLPLHQKVKREPIRFMRDASRVITRPHIQGGTERIKRTIDRVLRLSEPDAQHLRSSIEREFGHRHKDLSGICGRHFEMVKKYIPSVRPLSATKRFVIGAIFTMEYSLESAALFNPSIVQHPDQSNLSRGDVRFLMSLRATGEGHISSIVFRSGVVRSDNTFDIDPASRFAEGPVIKFPAAKVSPRKVSSYTLSFRPDQTLPERVIFPVLKQESKGIEDARFVRFVRDDGEMTYYGTYTAYDGFTILPQFIETKDFLTFRIVTLRGKAIRNKGMALFPRTIDGKYVMLSRQDGENNRIMTSRDLYRWESATLLQMPAQPWEFVQIGNCGSPIETEKGWLVLTHGVGPMRKYSIGAILLDLRTPTKVIARLEEPLIAPNEQEREGYVPNVVYSCGSMLHHDTLIIPYAMSDITSGIATVSLRDVLNAMKPVG